MGANSLAEAALVPHLQDTIAKLYTEGLVGADSLAEAAPLVPHLQDIPS